MRFEATQAEADVLGTEVIGNIGLWQKMQTTAFIATPGTCRSGVDFGVVNALNPKGTIFLLAVVPHFIDPVLPLWPQYFIIGATIGFTDLVVMGGYTALAAKVLTALKSPAHVGLLNRVFGSMFVVAGSLLATIRRAAAEGH